MRLLPDQSTCSSLHAEGNTIYVRRRMFSGYPQGTNKADEYSWFYIIALQGTKGEPVRLLANMSNAGIPSLTRHNSLLFFSTNQTNWQRLPTAVGTDAGGLKQYAAFTLPVTGRCFISNTIFYDLDFLRSSFAAISARYDRFCRLFSIGNSLRGRPIEIISFSSSSSPRGRILLTTGCHPAEPDVIASQSIMDWLVSPPGLDLLRHYRVDILPLSNPDGFTAKSCLTANGINLYWNFLKDDMANCPEAYHLWQYIRRHPPLLYLDFHAYVHQYHRHPMPYLKDLSAYRGVYPKRLVKQMDRLLIRQSGGFYRCGRLAMWPHSLSHFITQEFNTIAYTKYHFNLYEGIEACGQRAVNIFSGLTGILLANTVHDRQIFVTPHGQVQPDYTDHPPYTWLYILTRVLRQSAMFLKSYWRYYRHRNQSDLFNLNS